MKKGFTLIELLVVIAIISILAAIIYPTLLSTKRASWGAVCVSNLSQIGKANQMYIDAYDETLPPIVINFANQDFGVTEKAFEKYVTDYPYSIQNILSPFAKSKNIFKCPADNGAFLYQDYMVDGPSDLTLYERFGTSYRGAGELSFVQLGDIDKVSEVMMAADFGGNWHTKFNKPSNNVTDQEMLQYWASNCVFLDGHTKNVKWKEQIWNPLTHEFERLIGRL